MKRVPGKLSIALFSVLMLVGFTGCQSKEQKLDSERSGVIPADAALVARAEDKKMGLTFVASEEGRLYYMCGAALTTTVQVKPGDRVQLNPAKDRPPKEPKTRILVNGERVFGHDKRCNVNRFYFLPAYLE